MSKLSELKDITKAALAAGKGKFAQATPPVKDQGKPPKAKLDDDSGFKPRIKRESASNGKFDFNKAPKAPLSALKPQVAPVPPENDENDEEDGGVDESLNEELTCPQCGTKPDWKSFKVEKDTHHKLSCKTCGRLGLPKKTKDAAYTSFMDSPEDYGSTKGNVPSED